jgi:DNA modification methylase
VRIINESTEMVELDKLRPHPKNPRQGDVGAIHISIEANGFYGSVIAQKSTGHIIAGNHRYLAAKHANAEAIPVTWVDVSDEEAVRILLADNRTNDLATYNDDALAELLEDLMRETGSVEGTGYDADDLDDLLRELQGQVEVTEDEVPEPPADPITKPGDLWLLGDHRLLCGDSTDPADVARLMNGRKALLLHADPPYGMGKEGDGVINDNLYREKLDKFQMQWWRAVRPHLTDNASAYVWGNAPDLWRLWYVGGLNASERFEFRNEIVWNKKAIPGMASGLMTQYPEASERCLFFQFGHQFISNINADDFPDQWEPLRSYMEGEARAAGITAKDIQRVCGCQMYGHWFTRSQFTLILEKHYITLRQSYPEQFARPWSELKKEWDAVKVSGRKVAHGKLDEMRSYFDNAHDIMIDVWEFPRVTGEERHGHATPKPVAMMARCLTSSAPAGGLVVEPFIGSGSTLMAAEQCGRVCYGLELSPEYCDVTVARWEKLTGKKARLEGADNGQIEA